VLTYQIVAKGRISVNGSSSSASSNAKTMLLPKSDRKIVAAIGAHTMSVASPRIGTSSEEVPITSTAKQSRSLGKSGSVD